MSDQLTGIQNLAEIPLDVKDFLIKTCSVPIGLSDIFLYTQKSCGGVPNFQFGTPLVHFFQEIS